MTIGQENSRSIFQASYRTWGVVNSPKENVHMLLCILSGLLETR
jgi:hypothetical protein